MAARILIAEDHLPFAEALEKLLVAKGLNCERVADGIGALQRILAAPPDLLLLDLQLPGLHGIELLRKLRSAPRTAGLPVIVMSGIYKGDRYVQAARSLGVSTYLEKPFLPAALLGAIQQTLTPPAAPAAAPRPNPGLERLLASAFMRRFSGQLQLEADTSHTLTFINGAPVALRPGFKHRDFGEYLFRQGLLSAEEYACYAQAGEYRHNLLVQMGCLDYPTLLEKKHAYLSSELTAAFTLPPPRSATETPLAMPPGLQVLTVNMPQILYRGFHALFTPERSRRWLEQAGPRYVATTPAYYELINFLQLNEAERRLLPLCDGTRTVAAIMAAIGENHLVPCVSLLQTLGMLRLDTTPLSAAPLPSYPLRALFNAIDEVEVELPPETMESFADLVDKGMELDLAPPSTTPDAPPAPTAPAGESTLSERVRATLAKVQGKSYYEIFDMTQGNFSFERLKTGYFAITREFGPDVLMQLGGEEAGMVEEILSTVATAYNTLSDVVKKENYDQLFGADKIGLGHKGDDRFQAQVQAQSAKVFIAMEEWDNAEKALQDACGIDPDNGDYLAHLAWSIYRNPKYANSRAMLDKAKQLLNRALTLERTADGFAFKGWLLLDSGQDNLAEGEFNKSLKLDARNALARKGLRQVQEHREQQKKGLFGRMFGG